MDFYVTEQLGPTQSLTPEGYLLCEGVGIARTGTQVYAGQELPELIPGTDGLIKVIRDEVEVFRPETLASFEGKSVTIEHHFVDSKSWQDLTVGTVQNVRRGEGDRNDLVIADLLLTVDDVIELVRVKKDTFGMPIPGAQGMRDVSCGYEADYVQEGVGVAYQRNIIGNHVALVPRGRAGPRCSIQDGDINMAAVKTGDESTLLKRLLKAFRSGDADAIKAACADADDETPEEKEEREAKEKSKKTEDSLAKLTRTVDALAMVVGKLVKDDMPTSGEPTEDGDETEEEKKKRMEDEDAAEKEKIKTGDAMNVIKSRAEILVPGMTLPTMDGAPTSASLVTLRRHVLQEAAKTADNKAAITSMLGGVKLATADAATINVVFNAAAEMARVRNNNTKVRTGDVKTADFGKASSIADINARNAEFWKNNG